jgi:hypothetical protein
MPTATDLVTDLPADFAVFGQGVDTTMADLKGGTTGQMLVKATNTDMDFNWVTPEIGDITAVNAGTGISGGGTTGAVTITNSMATAMTTSGDLIQATGSGTFARLGTGTSGQYLTTNGTTNSWGTIAAGGQTLISTTTISGTTTNISSIPATYNDLQLIIINAKSSSNGDDLWLRVNGQTGANYMQQFWSTAPGNQTFSTTRWTFQSSVNSTTTSNIAVISFPNYANTASWKVTTLYSVGVNGTTSTVPTTQTVFGSINQTSAISSINITSAGGGTMTGTAYLYGIK